MYDQNQGGQRYCDHYVSIWHRLEYSVQLQEKKLILRRSLMGVYDLFKLPDSTNSTYPYIKITERGIFTQ